MLGLFFALKHLALQAARLRSRRTLGSPQKLIKNRQASSRNLSGSCVFPVDDSARVESILLSKRAVSEIAIEISFACDLSHLSYSNSLVWSGFSRESSVTISFIALPEATICQKRIIPGKVVQMLVLSWHCLL